MKETIIFFCVLVVLFFIGRFVINNRDKEVLQNCDYSYAYVTNKYEYGELAKGGKYGTGASLESIDFYYEINGQKYYDRCTIPRKTGIVKKGDKYLIVISKDDNEKFIVMFKYPIKDSADFKRYVKKFEQDRLQGQNN